MSNISSGELKTFTIKNKIGSHLTVTNFGGKVMSLWVPDREGKLGDIVLGYDTAEEYLSGKSYFGAIIGRYANRIANGQFNLEGLDYYLAKNNGRNSLHGGPGGFNNVLWQVVPAECPNGESLRLSYESQDGEEGFPGKLSVQVTYTILDDNDLVLTYEATTNKTTIANLTHHSFFNLAGEGNGDILDHELKINADQITELDENQIPTGKFISVNDSPFDFRAAVPIRKKINYNDNKVKIDGFDHNWVLRKKGGFSKAAMVREPSSGRVMEVWTTQPGLQFYSGNNLNDNVSGKGGKKYPKQSAFCLEDQYFPDSPNHPHFPSTILHPGEKYFQKTVYKFRTY
ncbi:MAG: aldose epimerase family protein [Cyclobacteriaceae bacterium]